MEPMQINGGRFYVRPLLCDDRIDDRPALAAAYGHPVDADIVEAAASRWREDTEYSWASCEATCIDMAALVTLTLTGEDTGVLRAICAGDPDTVLPNPEDLERKTRRDAAHEGAAAVARWARGFAGITITDTHLP